LWASLCVRIEQLLSHQTELLPIDLPLAVEKAAQRIAAQLIEQRRPLAKQRLRMRVIQAQLSRRLRL